ncbi:MAG: hypothetical protein MZV70_45405 [Desulfobacterales bacterium]|nr:hypothetical protein [Desulfobacterales bacterium]
MTILLIQAAAYAAAQWIQFDRLGLTYDDGTSVPFLAYFDLVTRSLTLTIGHAKEPTSALGAWGYASARSRLAGFAGGGLVIPRRAALAALL